ncbi:MAG: DUF1552 domain-containing protein [Planctomycetes bacterium]|nr:DUF1552 domain-containing protein [Planctomycetota bacterium]
MTLSRRNFLSAAGVTLALPFLPSLGRAADVPKGGSPRRMLAICNNLGLVPWKFFPEQGGRDYKASPYLELLAEHRRDFTVFSGVSHPYVDGGHPADICFLTAAPHPSSGGFRNTISLDQHIAQHIGHQTRFPTLTLGVNISGQRSLSWTAAGVMIPCETQASAVFRKLFIQGTPAEIAAQKRRLALGRSVMDAVGDQLSAVKATVNAHDRDRLDQYLTGVRDLEGRLETSSAWEDRPKPKIDAKEPTDPKDSKEYFARTRLMYDMARLALQTDSTRLITLMLDSVNSPAVEVAGAEIKDGYHSLSHHGKTPAKISQLEAIDSEHMKALGELYSELKAVQEPGGTLFDHTMVLYGTNMGDANTHVTTNLPVLFAGGGFKHGQHLAFDRQHNYPLPNLFVSMLQRMGLETDKFASSTGTMTGLEMA